MDKTSQNNIQYLVFVMLLVDVFIDILVVQPTMDPIPNNITQNQRYEEVSQNNAQSG
jgi:hypothetical protein